MGHHNSDEINAFNSFAMNKSYPKSGWLKQLRCHGYYETSRAGRGARSENQADLIVFEGKIAVQFAGLFAKFKLRRNRAIALFDLRARPRYQTARRL